VDPACCADLYGDAERLARRTGALHRAKIAGPPVAGVIVDLAAEHLGNRSVGVVADLGCGRGTTTLALADRLRRARLVAVDLSPVVLASARARLKGDATTRVCWLCTDFHHLPIRDGACGLVVAAFCLYHSRRPAEAIAEWARCLAPGGIAVLVTKSLESYRALDELVAAAGLDPDACRRPSLYGTAHSGNLAGLAAPSLTICHIEHHEHRFTFADLDHVADYLTTSPKYAILAGLRGGAAPLAGALRARLPDEPVTTTSTVTYVIGVR
jgi:SAM-dependent methyltransferase